MDTDRTNGIELHLTWSPQHGPVKAGWEHKQGLKTQNIRICSKCPRQQNSRPFLDQASRAVNGRWRGPTPLIQDPDTSACIYISHVCMTLHTSYSTRGLGVLFPHSPWKHASLQPSLGTSNQEISTRFTPQYLPPRDNSWIRVREGDSNPMYESLFLKKAPNQAIDEQNFCCSYAHWLSHRWDQV